MIIDLFLHHRRRQEIAKMNIALATAIVGLKYFLAVFDRIALKIRARERITYILRMSLVRYTRKQRRHGAGRWER